MAEEFAWVKDVAIPVVGIVVGFLGARISDWSRTRDDTKKREVDHEAVQLTYDQAQMNTLTERFKTLMDGYERRINDLISEVKDLRERLSTAESKLRDVHNASNAAT